MLLMSIPRTGQAGVKPRHGSRRCTGGWLALLALSGAPAAPATAASLVAVPGGCDVDPAAEVPLADSVDVYLYESEHFRLHYRLEGADSIAGAPGIASVESLAAGLESAYAAFRDTLGLPTAPPGEEGHPVPLQDCDLRSLGRALGWAQRICESLQPCVACRGNIGLHPRLPPSRRRGVAAHEYFHLVQYATGARADGWFLESTAEWAQRIANPGDPSYAVLVFGWFALPWKCLWEGGLDRAYGSALFWAFIEETRGHAFIAALIRNVCDQDWRDVLDGMLRSEGSSFGEALAEFSVWCTYTGTRDDGHHFRDGGRYPEVSFQAVHRNYPVEAASLPPAWVAQRAASNYIRFSGPGSRDSLRVSVRGSADTAGRRTFSLVALRGADRHSEYRVTPDSTGAASFAVPEWPECESVILIVTNHHDAEGELGFDYSAEESGRPVSAAEVVCVPSPFSSVTEIRFLALTPPVGPFVDIFDARGRRVREVFLGSVTEGVAAVEWDGSDATGARVPAGCYFIRGRWGQASCLGKVIRVR